MASVILVVEDNREMQNLLRMLLELEGHEVALAADGRSANEWLTGRRPSLLLLDWMLPDMDGAAVAEHLRAVHGDEVPILLVTADSNSGEKATRIGAAGYIAKPFALDDIVAAVQRTLDLHSANADGAV